MEDCRHRAGRAYPESAVFSSAKALCAPSSFLKNSARQVNEEQCLRSKFITKGLQPADGLFSSKLSFHRNQSASLSGGAKHLFAFGFQRSKYAVVQFCQAERRTNSGNAAAFFAGSAPISLAAVCSCSPAGQSIPLCRNVCTFICRSSIEDISRQQCAEECVTVLRHFGQCFQHWADKLSILLFSAVQHSTDDTGVLTVCFRPCVCGIRNCAGVWSFFFAWQGCCPAVPGKAGILLHSSPLGQGSEYRPSGAAARRVCPLLFEICGQIGAYKHPSPEDRVAHWGWCLCQTTGVNIDLLDVEVASCSGNASMRVMTPTLEKCSSTSICR